MMHPKRRLSPHSDMHPFRALLNCLYPRVRAIREQMMKKLWWLLLAALPYPAVASMEDPVARPCYMCTASEMYERAESLGVGQHYIYDGASWTNIQGFNVTEVGGQRVATHFVPEPWIRTQYNALMRMYDAGTGRFVDQWGTVDLPAPGSPHGFNAQTATDTVLWGHHVSDLNPSHPEARQTVNRLLSRAVRFSFLHADTEHGRILRFESQADGRMPLISKLNIFLFLGWVESFFDYDTRQWVYLRSSDGSYLVQEKAEDFLYSDGTPRTFTYTREFLPYFQQRADWAGVAVVGQPPMGYRNASYRCSIREGKPLCELL
jgi:hypothetical protein